MCSGGMDVRLGCGCHGDLLKAFRDLLGLDEVSLHWVWEHYRAQSHIRPEATRRDPTALVREVQFRISRTSLPNPNGFFFQDLDQVFLVPPWMLPASEHSCPFPGTAEPIPERWKRLNPLGSSGLCVNTLGGHRAESLTSLFVFSPTWHWFKLLPHNCGDLAFFSKHSWHNERDVARAEYRSVVLQCDDVVHGVHQRCICRCLMSAEFFS